MTLQPCAIDASPNLYIMSDRPPTQTAPFFRLPIELRNAIYRLLVVSPLSDAADRQWYRPLCVDHVIFNVGYFRRDSVLPLLRTCHQIHTEATRILYGENAFVFHYSSIANAPLPFFSLLPSQYLRLMRKAYLFTEYILPWPMQPSNQLDLDFGNVDELDRQHSLERKNTILKIELEGSKMVARKALPAGSGFVVNSHDTTTMAAPGLHGKLHNPRAKAGSEQWWSASCQLWKMVPIASADSTCRQEFRRVVWTDTSDSSGQAEGDVAQRKRAPSLTATGLYESLL